MKKSNAPVKVIRRSSIVDRRTHAEKIAAAQKLKTPRKSRPKKPAWLVPEKLKSQAQIEREEMERVYGPVERREWMKRQTCIARSLLFCCGQIDGHHIKTDGTSRKAGYRWIVPLCRTHHEVLHGIGCRSFESAYSVDLEVEADRTHSRWEDHAETLGIDP